mmetsp:Transcript_5153/g.10669  ORF Transcript_5153/g.10669 Transcript_5153/m.10669 type:complete len:427 (-) Transcript_5153:39-1319(-)
MAPIARDEAAVARARMANSGGPALQATIRRLQEQGVEVTDEMLAAVRNAMVLPPGQTYGVGPVDRTGGGHVVASVTGRSSPPPSRRRNPGIAVLSFSRGAEVPVEELLDRHEPTLGKADVQDLYAGGAGAMASDKPAIEDPDEEDAVRIAMARKKQGYRRTCTIQSMIPDSKATTICAPFHGFHTGDAVVITGVAGGNWGTLLNREHVVSRVDVNTFTVGVNTEDEGEVDLAGATATGEIRMQSKPPPTGDGWDEATWTLRAEERLGEFLTTEEKEFCEYMPHGHAPDPAFKRGQKPANPTQCLVSMDPPDPLVHPASLPPREGPTRRAVIKTEFGYQELADVLEKNGIDSLPDWYEALDRIYEVSEMKEFSRGPSPAVPSSTLIGQPGYSFVVPKRRRSGSRKKDAFAFGLGGTGRSVSGSRSRG